MYGGAGWPAALSNFSPSRVWRSIVIMLASLIFLAMLAKSAVALIPLAAFLLFGYGVLSMRKHGWSRGGGLENSGSDLRLRVVEEVYVLAGTVLPALSLLHPRPFIYIFPASCTC
jgi:hypothetical protein